MSTLLGCSLFWGLPVLLLSGAIKNSEAEAEGEWP